MSSSVMKFLKRIQIAKSFSEVQKTLLEAKLFNQLSEAVVLQAITRVVGNDCRNFNFGYQLAKQVPPERLSFFDDFTLRAVLNCASHKKDYELARKALSQIKFKDSYNYYLFIASFKDTDMNAVPPEIKEELGSLWEKIEQSGHNGDCILLTQLYTLLSFSKEKQMSLILQVISKPPNGSYDMILLGNFMRHSLETNNIDLAEKVWNWGKPILESLNGKGNMPFFILAFQYYKHRVPAIDELNLLWREVERSGLAGMERFVSSMLSLLAFNSSEQKKFILSVLSKEPDRSLNCRFLGGLLKICTKTNDVDLAKDIWNWGKPLLEKEANTVDVFMTTFQYFRTFPPSLDQLNDLWSQVTNSHHDSRAELVSSMFKALKLYPEEQRNFMLGVISRQPSESLDFRVFEDFLKYCYEQNNLELAQKIWSWALELRERSKGTIPLSKISAQYLTICGASGDLQLLEMVQEEAEKFYVAGTIQFKEAFITALAANGSFGKVIKVVRRISSNLFDERLLNKILGILTLNDESHDIEAYILLTRLQQENPAIASVEAYALVVDAFSRKGKFDAALSLIEDGKGHGIEPNVAIWTSILRECRVHKNLEVALKAFEEFKKVKHEPEDLKAAFDLLEEVHQSCGEAQETSAHQL